MADLDALAALYSDPEIRRYFPDGVRTYEQTREELQWIIDVYYGEYGYGLWATILKDTGDFIGRCGLLPWEIDGRTEVEVAYLLDKSYWRRGLATEAAAAIVDYAFADPAGRPPDLHGRPGERRLARRRRQGGHDDALGRLRRRVRPRARLRDRAAGRLLGGDSPCGALSRLHGAVEEAEEFAAGVLAGEVERDLPGELRHAEELGVLARLRAGVRALGPGVEVPEVAIRLAGVGGGDAGEDRLEPRRAARSPARWAPIRRRCSRSSRRIRPTGSSKNTRSAGGASTVSPPALVAPLVRVGRAAEALREPRATADAARAPSRWCRVPPHRSRAA